MELKHSFYWLGQIVQILKKIWGDYPVYGSNNNNISCTRSCKKKKKKKKKTKKNAHLIEKVTRKYEIEYCFLRKTVEAI